MTADVTQHLDGATLRWAESVHCAHCGFAREADGTGWPPGAIRAALMRRARVLVRVGPERVPRAAAMRRLEPLLSDELGNIEAFVEGLLAGTFEATPIEAALLRGALPPFRVVATDAPPIAPELVPPGEILAAEPMWTSERSRYVLEPSGWNFVVKDRDGESVMLIEDDALATEIMGRMAEAGVPIVRPGERAPRTLTDEVWPLCLSPDEPGAFPYRLQDGRFQVVRDGPFPLLLCGPDHILVRPPFRDALREFGATGWSAVPAVLFDPTTREELRTYDELCIEHEVSPSTLEAAALAQPNGVWHFSRHAIFVARALGERLAARFPELHASVGFSEFG